MSRKKTYREYKFQTGKVLPRRDKHGFYKDRNERFFLEKPTRKDVTSIQQRLSAKSVIVCFT